MALQCAVQSASKVATKYTGRETSTVKIRHYLFPDIFGIFLMRISDRNMALTP